jgi:hypothetical protein
VTQIALPHGPKPVNPAGVIMNEVIAVLPPASVTFTVACTPVVPAGVPLIKPPPKPVDIDIPVGKLPVNS